MFLALSRFICLWGGILLSITALQYQSKVLAVCAGIALALFVILLERRDE